MFKKLNASYFHLSIWCLYQITNLCHFFLEPFILPEVLFLSDFYLLRKSECSLVKGDLRLGSNLLKDFIKWHLSFIWFLWWAVVSRRASVCPWWCILWDCWWHSEKPRSNGRNKLATGFFDPLFSPLRKSQWNFSHEYTNLVCIYTRLKWFPLTFL